MNINIRRNSKIYKNTVIPDTRILQDSHIPKAIDTILNHVTPLGDVRVRDVKRVAKMCIIVKLDNTNGIHYT